MHLPGLRVGQADVKRGTVKSLRVVEAPEKRTWSPGKWFGQGYTAPGMNWHGLENNMTTEITMALPRVGPEEAGGPILVVPGSDGRSDAAEAIEGALYQAEDMQTDRGGYYYLQDEQYMEHTVALEADLPTEIVRKLDSISQTYEKVRIVGVVLTDENEGTSRFDPSWDIEIFVDE